MIGSAISHYRILEELGRGALGVVYKAHDTKLDRFVALKFLSPHSSASGADKIHFAQEAKVAAALNHPNVCSIIDFEELDGQMFIVMEFIEGHDLRAIINKGPMEIVAAVKVALHVAEGLYAAHQRGLVHGDMKPENIIMTSNGIAKIADFGLAGMIEHAESGRSNGISGTLAYMSPEQINGDHANHLTDIWSLGVILYEMVAGQRPFTGEYSEALMYSVVNEKHRSVSELRRNVPSALVNIIDRCLAKKPVVRFPDANALAEDLRPLEREPRNPRTGASKSIAVLRFADISADKDNEYFSEGLTEEIIASLSKLPMMKVISRTSVMHFERAGKTMKQIAAELGVQYVLEGSVRKSGSDLRITTQLIDANQDAALWSETYSGSMDQVFEIQENVAGRIVKALKMRLTPAEKRTLRHRATENTEAYQLYLKGRFFWNKRSKDSLQRAIRYFEEAISKDARYALAWAGIADAYNLLSDYGNVSRKETYPKAKAAVQKALEFDSKLAEAHTSLALVLMINEFDWSNSEKEFKRAITLNPNYATTHHWYSLWLLYQGKTREAINEISRAVDLDPFSPAILKDKGLVLYYARDYDAAIEHSNKVLEFDSGFASAHRLLSLAYQGKGMFVEAIEENERWGSQSGDELEASVTLAQVYAVAGKRNEALALVNQVCSETLSSGNLMRGVALVYASLAENDLAFAWLEKAYESKAESLCTLKVDPKLDGIRSDRRYHSLLKKVRLDL